MLMAKTVTAALVRKGSQVHLFLFKSAFTLSDQKTCLPTLSKVFQSHCYIYLHILHILCVDRGVLDSLGPSNLSEFL